MVFALCAAGGSAGFRLIGVHGVGPVPVASASHMCFLSLRRLLPNFGYLRLLGDHIRV